MDSDVILLGSGSFCNTPFWNQSATWNTTNPALTPCFTDTAASWLPAALLWICFPWTLYDYLTSKRPTIGWNRFNMLKLVTAIALALVGAAHAIYVIVRWTQRDPDSNDPTLAELLAVLITFFTYCLLIIFVHFQRLFGFVNGGAIWFYLLLQIICSAFSIPTYLQYPDHRLASEQIFIYIELGIEVFLFLVISFPDRVPNLNELLSSASLYGQETEEFLIADNGDEDDEDGTMMKKKKKICPKETASFPSKLTFWWFNSIAFLGFRRPLTIDDLWQIRRVDRAANLFSKFNRYWRHKSFTGNDDDESHLENQILVGANGKHSEHVHAKKSIFGHKNTYSLNDYNLIGNGNHLDNGDVSDDETNSINSNVQPPPKTNVMSLMARQFWRYFMFPSTARFITDNLQLVNPIVMKYMISFTTDYNAPFWQGIFYTMIFVITNVVSSVTSAYHQHRMSILGMRIRTCLIGSIYRKSLVLANHSKKDYTTGEIVNLMAVDCQRFIDLLPWFCFLWTAPVQIAIALWLLWNELGISVLGGLFLMILFIPINGYIAGLVKKIQTKQMALKDKRLKAINEMLNGIKVLKLYAWEEAFIKNIQAIRVQELKYIRRSGYISTIFNLISACSPFMVSCLTFTIYIFVDPKNNKLTAEKAFVSIALFNLLRIPLAMIPNMMSNLILTLVSVKRLNKFLNSDETTPYVQRKVDKVNAITVTNASFNWDQIPDSNQKSNGTTGESSFTNGSGTPTGAPITLSNLNITIPKGSLVAVVGSVGSGKSSLLSALLGEMQKLTGRVNISGDLRLAYVSQQAWIQNSTVRGNILFGSPYDPKKYQRVIEACALKTDFEMLTAGDQTEIGEKGINLSGGQKQRVSIARACYSDADLYLFDDPLSAVDSHVGKHIFDEVLHSKTGILHGKTRILVTNALYMLNSVDQVVLLKNGTIEAVGTYDDLLQKSTVFHELITNYTSSNVDNENETDKVVSEQNAEEEGEEDGEKELNEDDLRDANLELVRSLSQSSSASAAKERSKSTLSIVSQKQSSPVKSEKSTKSKSKLIEAEGMETGQVTFSVYMKFFRSLSAFWTIMILFNYLAIIIASTGSNFWLSAWTSASDSDTRSHFYLLIYFFIGMSQVVFVCVGWISIVRGTMRASKTLHWRLMSSIVHAPMHFFDTTPLGRIVNRFSKDIDVLDSYMQFLLRVLLNTTFNVLATIFTVSFQTPLFMAVVVASLAVYVFIQRFYVSTSRQLKRLESVTRSPIFTHFSETINGVSTIKAYNASERFIRESDHRVDQNQRCFYPNAVASCFLQVRLEFLANLLIFFASLFAALNRKQSEDDSGLSGSGTGLSLSYALNVTLSLNVCIRMYADLENNVVSVERISEYSDVTPEAPWHKDEDASVDNSWPDKGEITFDGYGTRYRPGLDLVLRKVDIATGRGEKIGIVGRTGAGKSSLTLALFRIIEAANGKIVMDGIDISKLGLHTLRSRITIIPQDPVLFFGTIRSNLDPFNKYNDEELWHVLELSHLKPFVKSLELGLEYPVAEAGENLSVGQRQLICLARALLRKTNVLVLDEATAAVDLETDSLIQSTIRAQFSHCTVLTIAHRLNTIMDSDRVLVLDAGNVAEFDSPKNLLADERSIFYSLAKDAGIV